MAEDPGADTRLIPVNGRQIVVRELLPAQAILIMRLIRNLRRDIGPDDVDRMTIINNTAKVLDIIESAVVQQEDRDYLEDLIVERKLDLKELVGVVTAFRDDVEEKPKVRRGRPRKSQ